VDAFTNRKSFFAPAAEIGGWAVVPGGETVADPGLTVAGGRPVDDAGHTAADHDRGQMIDAGRGAVEAVLADPSLIRPLFQPIVDLQRSAVWGFEMLARFGDDPGGSPLRWLAAAERHGLGAELEACLVAAGIAAREQLPRGTTLSINVSPSALVSPQVRAVLDAAPGGLSQIVLEVTEQRRVEDYGELAKALARARAAGAAVAVDQAGADGASLQNVVRLRPEYVKLDRALVADADADPDKLAIIEAIGLFAGRLDAALVAGGIERRAEQEMLSGLAVPLGQGYLFGRPVPSLVTRPLLLATRRPVDEPLGTLMDRSAPMIDASLLAAGAEPPASARGQVVTIVDRDGRPAGLAVPSGPGWTTRMSVLSAGVDEEAAAVARRALDRPLISRLDPVCACLDDGRFAGLVAVERLLGAGPAMSRTPIFLPV
jgi:EAL domain-containing protein (putative c-di-GMP-specific phosphodiesterase class I)